MRFIKSFLVLFFSLLVISSFAQSEKKLMQEGEKAYNEGFKTSALDFYLKAYDINPDNAELNYQIGKIYLETIHKTKSLPYLQKAYALNDKFPNVQYYLGRSYHYNHEFDKAIEFYDQAKKETQDAAKIKDIDRKIYECNNGKLFVENPVEVKIENMGTVINTKYPEYAPIVSADESTLIFTSRREGSTGGFMDEKGEFYEDIYISEKQGKSWSAPRNISAAINTSTHDASIGLSPNGKELFIYKDDGAGDIYMCLQKRDGTWSKPEALDINSKKNYENSAAITPDGKKLFFTSNREGGYGDLDIYVSEKGKDGKWGEPVNLGPTVNTEGAEEGPFLDLDGRTLYFASTMHNGMGDFDIFKTVYDSVSNSWSDPENLGYPINSADEDLYFTLSGDGRHAYFASAKENSIGDKDLYMITMPPREDYEELVTRVEAISGKTIEREKFDSLKLKPKPEPEPVKEIVLQPVILKGTIKEVGSNQPLEAKVQVMDKENNVVYTFTTAADGQYLYEIPLKEPGSYTVSVEKTGYGFATKQTSTPAPGPEKEIVLVDLGLKKLDVGTKFVLRNIYFDFDKSTIKPQSEPELQKLVDMLNSNPNLKIEIGGHTDSYGSNSYNKDLSQRRANAVVKYLISKGIDKGRLGGKGYGEEKPIASNDDEIDGRELNRRTEFEVKGN